MIYDYIHNMVSNFLIDYTSLSPDLQVIVQLIELYGVFIFMKWALLPVRALIEWGRSLSRSIYDKKEWRAEWVRKQKRSLRRENDDS